MGSRHLVPDIIIESAACIFLAHTAHGHHTVTVKAMAACQVEISFEWLFWTRAPPPIWILDVSVVICLPFAPLLEKEGNTSTDTLVTDIADPLRVHWPSSWAGLATDDNQSDARLSA
jgi:hypothetical protein